MANDDENRLTGYPALPLNLNPYVRSFYAPAPAAGAILPAKGRYDVVFDSASSVRRGQVHLPLLDQRRDAAGGQAPDALGQARRRRCGCGSPTSARGSIRARSAPSIDGIAARGTYSRKKNRVTITTGALARGTHRLTFQVSDYQETRNMENVGPILPNTRTISTTFRVRS